MRLKDGPSRKEPRAMNTLGGSGTSDQDSQKQEGGVKMGLGQEGRLAKVPRGSGSYLCLRLAVRRKETRPE